MTSRIEVTCVTMRAQRTGHAKSLRRSDSSSRTFVRAVWINGNTVYSRKSISLGARHAADSASRAPHLGSDVWQSRESAVDEFTRIRNQEHDRIADVGIQGEGLSHVLLGARVREF